MQKLPILKPGDCVEIIAPASRCTDEQLIQLKELLDSWELKCLIHQNLFGDDLLCANSDEHRLNHLVNALNNPQTKAVICARGGYGSMRLIPELLKSAPPEQVKLFVGLSDITALHLFFQKQWQWPTVHASLSPSKVSVDSLAAIKNLLFGKTTFQKYGLLTPLNEPATHYEVIESSMIGGNLTLVQASIGTPWQLDANNKIVLLEEVGERGYRVDRMLEHLVQAQLLYGVKAILFSDFLECTEPDGSCLIDPILKRFAEQCSIPVLKMEGVGHGWINYPVPFGTKAVLTLGDRPQLVCER